MDTFKERYRPAHLADIHGQREVVDQLKILARAPRPCCLLFVGDTGVGKSTAAEAFARDLGLYEDQQPAGELRRDYVYTLCAADMTADNVRHFFGGPNSPFKYRGGGPKRFHLLVVEELEYVDSRVAPLLKDSLERKLASYNNAIVIATSNSTAKIPRAVLDRFKRFDFDSGLGLAQAVQQWLPTLWERETARGVPLPEDWHTWGWDFEAEEFSARRAVDALEEAVRMRTVEAVRRVGA